MKQSILIVSTIDLQIRKLFRETKIKYLKVALLLWSRIIFFFLFEHNKARKTTERYPNNFPNICMVTLFTKDKFSSIFEIDVFGHGFQMPFFHRKYFYKIIS